MTSQPVPQGKYAPATRFGALIFTSGMTPRHNGELMFTGPVRRDNPIESNRQAVALACDNALAAARGQLSEGETLGAVLSMTVYVMAEPGFTAHASVGDLASDHLIATLGSAHLPSRATVGVASLPSGAPIEIQLTAYASTPGGMAGER